MTIRTGTLSKIFNWLAPGRVQQLNKDLWANASTVHEGVTGERLWAKLERLLKQGADINAINGNGDTALNLLCAEGHSFAAMKFLEHGAAPGPANKGGMTPFLSAAHAGDPELLRALLSHGANISDVTPQNENAIGVLLGFVPARFERDKNHPQRRCATLKVLLDAGMELNQSQRMRIFHHRTHFLSGVPEMEKVHDLKLAMKSFDLVKTHKLVNSGVHPDAPSRFGDQSVLAFAAGLGDLGLIDLALSKGADIDLLSGDERATALQFAVKQGQREAFVKLLDLGAKIDVFSPRHDEPVLLNIAKTCADPGMLKFVADEVHERTKHKLVLENDITVTRLRLKPRTGGPMP
jgi:ankyrin repeat protein